MAWFPNYLARDRVGELFFREFKRAHARKWVVFGNPALWIEEGPFQRMAWVEGRKVRPSYAWRFEAQEHFLINMANTPLRSFPKINILEGYAPPRQIEDA